MGIKDDKSLKQTLSIKRKLMKAFVDSGLSLYAVHAALAKREDGFKLSYNTIRTTLDPTDTSPPNLFALISLARLWNLDTASLLAPPVENVEDDSNIRTIESLMKSGKYIVLDHWAYQGEFHGYMLNPNTSRKEIVPFELEIKKDEASGKVDAYMTYHSKPIEHENQRLYYRPGIAITITSAERSPIALNFVLFENPLPQEKIDKYVPGLLKISGSNFMVEESVLDELKEDPDVQVFMDALGYIVKSEKSQKNVIRIKDSQIMTSIDDVEQWESIMKALVMLKGRSLAPDWIQYTYVKDYTRFGKMYLQNDDKE